MGTAKYKTSDDGYFRLWAQQTGISGNNAVITVWMVVKGRYNASSAYIAVSAPKFTVNSTWTGSNYYGGAQGADTWVEVYRKTGITVPYATGATGGSVAITAAGTLSYENDGGDDQYKKYESVTANFTMDTRTVTSTLTVPALTLGTAATFTISAAASSYTHTLTYSCGSASGTIGDAQTASRSISWTPPASLGAQAPTAYTVPITFTLTTYNGSNAIGSASYTDNMTVPTYAYTLGNVTAARGTAYANVTAYVAGKTDVKFTAPAIPAAQYGATGTYTLTVTQGSTVVKTQTITSGQAVTLTPTGTGATVATVKYTDTRGVSATKTATVTYAANTMPTVTLTAYRTATSGGTVQDVTGLYYRATASGTYNAITGNTATLTLGGTSQAGSSGTVTKTVTGALAATNTLSITATVTDYLGNVASASAVIPQGFAVVQFGTGSDHKGVSIGKVGQVASAGFLEVGYGAKFDDDIYVKGVKVPTSGGGSGTITGVSVNGTSVATSGVANITSIPAEIVSGEVSRATNATTAAGLSGTLPVANGGTGQTTRANAANSFINALSTGASTPTDADYYVSQYVGGGTTTTTFHRRPVSALWAYIKGKISSVLGLTETSYNGKAASATAADTAATAGTSTIAENVNASNTGTGDTAGRWTVNVAGVTELKDGLTIKIRLTKSYNSTFNTLNVNGLGEKLVWYRSNSRLTSHIPQYGVIALTYYSGNTMGSAYSITNAYAADYTDKGAWKASTAYAVGDKVTNGSTSYICKTAHTSASSFATTNWNTLTTPSTTLVKATSATVSITDGWFLEYQYQDGNDPNYQHRGNEIYQKSINNNMGRYQIVLTNRNGEIFPINSTNNSTSTSKTTFTTASFAPEAKILYYNSTTEYTTNQNWSSGSNFYDQHNNVDLRYSFNISSSVNKLTTYLPVYLVAVPQADGQFKLYYGANGTTYAACLTQTLPTTDDGLVYIMLGVARSTYQINMWLNKPIYWYKGGAIREYINGVADLKVNGTSVVNAGVADITSIPAGIVSGTVASATTANTATTATSATTATKLGSSTVGSASKPVYLNSGAPTECTTYAGGTAVTLNGSGKGGSTASFYAPTAAGTSGQVLTSTGGVPSWAGLPSSQTTTAISLTASAKDATTSTAICTLTNRSYNAGGFCAYVNLQCVVSSGVSLAGNDWWRFVRGFPAPKGATASTSDMGVSLNAVIYKSDGNYSGQVDAHIAYHSAETNRPAGWYLRVHTNVQITAGMKIIVSGSYLI